MLAVILYVVYYTMVICQFLGKFIQFTNRKMSFIRALIPFYFWMAPTNEKVKNTRRIKPIIKK